MPPLTRCGACAQGQLHYGLVTGLAPQTTYYYIYGDATAGFGFSKARRHAPHPAQLQNALSCDTPGWGSSACGRGGSAGHASQALDAVAEAKLWKCLCRSTASRRPLRPAPTPTSTSSPGRMPARPLPVRLRPGF